MANNRYEIFVESIYKQCEECGSFDIKWNEVTLDTDDDGEENYFRDGFCRNCSATVTVIFTLDVIDELFDITVS